MKKKKIKILIMGLPGSGKTTLAKRLAKHLNADWLNADKIRGKYEDWDFTKEGIIRQVKRMNTLATSSKKKYVVADFVCPYERQMKIFKPNLVIWMDTIKKGRYPSMNKIFKNPKRYNLRFKEKNLEINLLQIKDQIVRYKWNEKNPTAQMLGRYQPWHTGHRKLFEEIIKKNDQVNIQVKNVKGIGDNPFTFKEIKKRISKDLVNFKNRIKITLAPNIVQICYGRTVGYKIKKIKLSNDLERISATKLRKILRFQGKL